jgi:hypothetical protein
MINTSRLLKSGALAIVVACSVPAAEAQVGTPYGAMRAVTAVRL